MALWALVSPVWWAALAVFTLVVVVALAWARVPWRTWLSALAAPAVFIVVGALGVAIGWGATPDAVVRFGPLQVTSASAEAAMLAGTRAFAVAAAVLLLAATSPVSELLSGLRRIGVPSALVDIAASTYRMIFLLLERARLIRQAQASRLGYSSARRAVRATSQLFATVFTSAWLRATRLEAGLQGRGGTAELVPVGKAIPATASFAAAVLAVNAAAAVLMFSGWWWR